MSNHVLVVEHDLVLQHFTRRVLAEAGYEVQTAISGYDALAMAVRRPPCLILLADGGTPGPRAFLLELRARQIGKTLPVVLMAAKPMNKLAEMAWQLRADGYLQKPFGQQELLKLVAQLCDADAAPDEEDDK